MKLPLFNVYMRLETIYNMYCTMYIVYCTVKLNCTIVQLNYKTIYTQQFIRICKLSCTVELENNSYRRTLYIHVHNTVYTVQLNLKTLNTVMYCIMYLEQL